MYILKLSKHGNFFNESFAEGQPGKLCSNNILV